MCGWFYKDYFLCFITPKFPTVVIRVWSPDHHVLESQPMFVYRVGRTRALCISTAVTKYLVPTTEGGNNCLGAIVSGVQSMVVLLYSWVVHPRGLSV